MRVRMCQPFQFPAATYRLYLGRGDVTFRDVTNQSGVDAAGGKGLGVVVADLDEDGRLEVFVANDTRANFLFRGDPARKNEFGLGEVGLTAGVGLSGDGRAEGSMGVAVGDADGDGRVDLFVTNFLDETNTLSMPILMGISTCWSPTATSTITRISVVLTGWRHSSTGIVVMVDLSRWRPRCWDLTLKRSSWAVDWPGWIGTGMDGRT